MAFELEALVGQLYVAGGRTIKTSPPGTLCEVAPKTAARGREIDTLFILVLPSGNVAPNTFYEQMSLMAAERYFSNAGSVTSALRDVFNTLNHNLFNHNSSGRKHYEANMITAVMRGTDLYVARAGAAILVLHQDAEVKTVPENLHDDDKLFKPPLGVQPIPEIEMSRFTLSSSARMLLSDATITEITQENLTKALVSENIEIVLDELKLLVTLQIQLMAVEFVPPEQPVMVPAATGQSSAVLAAEIAAARAKTGTQKTEVSQDDSRESPTASRPKRRTAQNRLKKRAKEGVVEIVRSAGHGMTAMGNLGEKLVNDKATPNERRRNTTLIAGAVIGIPAIIVAVVMLTWVLNIGQTQYEECVTNANKAAGVARSVPPDNRMSIITAWDGTLRIASECKALRPEFNDPVIQTIEFEGRLAVDILSGITRVDAKPLWVSPDTGANISEIVLKTNSLDLYALDSNNSIVYRMQMDETGTNLAAIPQPLQFMSRGARLDGNILGQIISIAYDDSRDLIIALDENGLLVTCRALFVNNCQAQQLQGFENVRNPIRISMWQGLFYVLDTGSSQIWRFSPIGNTQNFANPPTEYYQGVARPPNLDRAVDFAIGSENTVIGGQVFVLFTDGTMSRHRGGEALGFGFSDFPDGLETPDIATTQSMYLNDSSINTGFYILSRPYKTLYYITTAGTFQAAYRITDESLFERLNDVAVDPEQDIIYAASGNAILIVGGR